MEPLKDNTYEKSSQYINDCALTVLGSCIDNNYKKLNFEDIIDIPRIENKIFSNYISFVKNTEPSYINKDNFIDYHLQKTGKNSLVQEEEKLINFIEEIRKDPRLIDKLKDPKPLYEKLKQATDKIRFKENLDLLTCSETWNISDPISWTDEFFEKLKNKTQEISTTSIGDNESILYAQDVADYYSKIYEDKLSRVKRKFYWDPLDNLISEGPIEGQGGIIAGSTGMGKSALCINILDHLIEADIPCMYFPIEMGKENSLDRLISKRTKIPYRDLINPKPENFNAIKEAIDEEMKRFSIHSNFVLCDDPSINMNKLKSYIKQFQDQLEKDGKEKYCIVLIDLLTMISEFYMNDNMAQGIEKAINQLSILAKQLGFHYIGVVQLNRTVEQDKVTSISSINNLKPTRASVKNSNALLERSRYMLSVFRPKYFADLYLEPEEAKTINDIMEISLLKSSNNTVGKFQADYNGPCFLIEERAETSICD